MPIATALAIGGRRFVVGSRGADLQRWTTCDDDAARTIAGIAHRQPDAAVATAFS